MRTNPTGIALIKQFEGLRLVAYDDGTGRLTIGYGHAHSVTARELISESFADILLDQDLADAERSVLALVQVPLTSNQFSALVSFVFNLGAGSLRHSHLLTYVNAQMWNQAADAFLAWDHAAGVEVAGLKRRREAERQLFLTPDNGVANA